MLEGRDYLENKGTKGRIILKRMLNILRGCGLDLSDSGWGQVAVICAVSNEHSHSIKDVLIS
jgi:hypothetical protein